MWTDGRTDERTNERTNGRKVEPLYRTLLNSGAIIKTSEPRKFWKFLNGNKKNTSNISVEKCFKFFKDINSSQDEENIGQNIPENNADDIEHINEEINGPILWSEIEKAVRSLKNNKSSGLDEILNEHIKSSYNLPSMRNVLLKFFNIVFDSGLVPT